MFKDVTYAQTKIPEFREKVDEILLSNKRKQLGAWNHDFEPSKQLSRCPNDLYS